MPDQRAGCDRLRKLTNPMRDPALGVEIGHEAQGALMNADDWGDLIDKMLAEPVWTGERWERVNG